MAGAVFEIMSKEMFWRDGTPLRPAGLSNRGEEIT